MNRSTYRRAWHSVVQFHRRLLKYGFKNIEYQDKIGGEISHKDKKQIIAFEIEKEREKMEEKLEEMNNKITYGQYLHQIEEQEDDAKEVLEEAEQIRKEGLEHRIRMEKLEEELRRMVRKKFFDD